MKGVKNKTKKNSLNYYFFNDFNWAANVRKSIRGKMNASKSLLSTFSVPRVIYFAICYYLFSYLINTNIFG